MSFRKIAVAALIAAASLSAQAYDYAHQIDPWSNGVVIAQIDTFNMPVTVRVVLPITAATAGCPAGSWWSYTGSTTDATKAMYASMMLNMALKKSIVLYGFNANCTIANMTFFSY